MHMHVFRTFAVVALVAFELLRPEAAVAQEPSATGRTLSAASAAAIATPPPGYVIGPEDQLSVVFWRDKDMTADVVVRPDGKISVPLLNDVQAAGFTPEQLRAQLTQAASKYVEDPNVTVVVREIHSRNVFITGSVAKPGLFALNGDMNVLQLIALAGGLLEYADMEKISVLRNENGRSQSLAFNYKDVVKRKKVEQNIMLRPGDTVIVP